MIWGKRRCRHWNIEILVEMIGHRKILMRGNEELNPWSWEEKPRRSGRYWVECRDCGMRRWYTKHRMPKWFRRRLYLALWTDQEGERYQKKVER